ncbi:MAG: DUF5711 family protein [Eubacteriales bacterium]|nr:DUF5711 family protein [Eubacteriales bacterium]
MADINYDLFNPDRARTLRENEKKEIRKKRIKQLGVIVLILFLFLIIYIIQQSRCDYYQYKESAKSEENGAVAYETFAGGIVKYSSNGIEFQKNYGIANWNISISFSQPFIAKTSKYLLLGNRGGNQAILFSPNGMVHEYTMKFPIVQMSVAENGTIEAILKGDNCNYIQIYTSEGNMIAETKVTLGETGYPLTAAMSPDGKQLAVSSYIIENLTAKTRITFYDFSQQIQADGIPLKGGFDYEDNLVPRLHFLGKNKVVAIGDRASYTYNLSNVPKETKREEFEESIESVFIGDNYFGYVCDNEDPDVEGRYHLFLYDKSGDLKVDPILDMNYQDIYMIGDDIIATKDNECTIINKHGNIIFQGVLDGSRIEKVLPCEGWRTYRVVFTNKIVKMKLSFFEQKDKVE